MIGETISHYRIVVYKAEGTRPAPNGVFVDRWPLRVRSFGRHCHERTPRNNPTALLSGESSGD
jgi:hypothetical protein